MREHQKEHDRERVDFVLLRDDVHELMAAQREQGWRSLRLGWWMLAAAAGAIAGASAGITWLLTN